MGSALDRISVNEERQIVAQRAATPQSARLQLALLVVLITAWLSEQASPSLQEWKAIPRFARGHFKRL